MLGHYTTAPRILHLRALYGQSPTNASVAAKWYNTDARRLGLEGAVVMSVHNFAATSIDGKEVPLSEFKGKTLLIVNTASRCGATPQYAELQELYDQYKDRDFAVLGFPCNQFGAQEPGTEEEIKQFCETNYKVSFPMFAKIDVNGEQAHPLYRYLVEETAGDKGPEPIAWNFTKFLIDKNGQVVKRFDTRQAPKSFAGEIEAALS
jgi:glutathione peroxidase